MKEPASDEDQRIVQEMIGRFDAPSFMRRAKQVENTWQQLLDNCQKERTKQLEIVRLRLGQLHALAGDWEPLREWLSVGDVDFLRALFEELQPRLRLSLEATTSHRVLRSAVRDLVEAIEFFNARWQIWLRKLDLQPVNRARDAFNRYYLLEKECAFGSAALARIDFQPVPMLTIDDVARHFPLLRVPHCN